MNKLVWIKSSYSGGSGGNCIEVADRDNRVIMVRDTKQAGQGPMLTVSSAAWRSFTATVKASLAADPVGERSCVWGRSLLVERYRCYRFYRMPSLGQAAGR